MTKSLSRHPSQPPEDWDHPESMSTVDSSSVTSTTAPTTSRVLFPSQGGGAAADLDAPTPDVHSHRGGRAGKRTLSEVLKLHAEKGTDVHFSSEEANRLEELLGQWVRLIFISFFPPSFFSVYLSCFMMGLTFCASLLGSCVFVDVDQLKLVAVRRGR